MQDAPAWEQSEFTGWGTSGLAQQYEVKEGERPSSLSILGARYEAGRRVRKVEK